MLFLVFHIGNDRYALEARRVVEVVPLLGLKKVPQAPAAFAGIFNYRGRPVPAIDLCQLTLGQPALERLSTRIVVVHYTDSAGEQRLLGLVAERTTDTLRLDPRDFVDAGVRLGGVP